MERGRQAGRLEERERVSAVPWYSQRLVAIKAVDPEPGKLPWGSWQWLWGLSFLPHQHITPTYLQQASAGPQQAMLSHINTHAVLPGPSSAYTNPHRLTHYTLADRNAHLIWYSCLVTGWIFLPPERADVCENQNQQLVVPIFPAIFFGPNRISQSSPLIEKNNNFQFSHFHQRY